MANTIYSTTCSIPSPKDVYYLPLVLFSETVMTGSSNLLNKVGQTNYQSYIIAIAKFAYQNAPWSDETILSLKKAAKQLNKTLCKKGIVMHALEKRTMELLLDPNIADFGIFYECYQQLKTLV